MKRIISAGVGIFLISLQAMAAGPVEGRFVRVQIPRKRAGLMLAEVEVFSGGKNVARRGRPHQIAIYRGAGPERVIDGNTNTIWSSRSICHTPFNLNNPWWEVDLVHPYPIEKLNVWNWSDAPSRLNGGLVMILSEDRKVVWAHQFGKALPKKNELIVDAAWKGPRLGKKIGGPIAPWRDFELVAAYEKKATWIESVLQVQARADAFSNLNPLIPLLQRDFPQQREEIHQEFTAEPSIYHRKQSGSFRELAERYLKVLPKETRTALEPFAKAAKTVKDLGPIRKAFHRNLEERRCLLALNWFNPAAMERAIRAYSKKYPSAYQEKSLLARFEQVKAAVAAAKKGGERALRLQAAQAVDALNEAVLMRHPAVDFNEILFIRRGMGPMMGFPQNWQGNSSIPLHGYVNDLVRAPIKQGRGPAQIIHTSDSFVGDVDLNFDADRLMFSSGKKGEPGWRVFETDIQGRKMREVTPDNMPDIDFYDPCYLPDGRVLFCATSGFHGVPCVTGKDFVGNLHLMEHDGSIRRLVFDQDNSWCPTVLLNGRVMYLRWEYTDSAHYFSRVLMTMNPDGSDQQEFYGSGSYWPNSCFYARPVPGSVTKFVGIVSGHHGVPRMGKMVLFDAAKGRLETSGAVQEILHYGKPVENKTRDRLVDDLEYFFLHPYPLSEELYLASLSKGRQGPFYLVLCDRYDNVMPLWYSRGEQLFEPLPLKKQPKPVLPIDRLAKGQKDCVVYMVSSEEGPGLRGIPKGKVKALRIYQYEYSPRKQGGHYHVGFEGPWDMRVILGTVPVEKDGSCIFRAPANTPIAVQPLDQDGKAMQLMRSWLVGMPGETISCMGCHEKQNAAAPVRASIAARRAPRALTPWYGPRRNFSFTREVQNVLDRSCVGCHNSKATAKNALGQPIPNFENTPGTDGYSTSYVNLHPYVRRNGPEGDYHVLTPLEFHMDTSELTQLLAKGHHGVKLSAEDWDRLTTWVDLNVPFWGCWSERNGEEVAATLARRREMAKRWANIDFNPEQVVNPYQKVAFVPPKKCAPVPAAPKLAGWPIADPKAVQGEAKPFEVDLGEGEKLSFVRIPAGSFVMGSNAETPMERPMSVVKIEKPFLMASKEITAKQMRIFDGTFDNGYYDMHYKDQVKRGYNMGMLGEFQQKGNDKFPAIRVSWEKANAFCAWLGQKIGKRVMLPTEAQWEWACRAGSDTPMNYGSFDVDFGTWENLADRSIILLAVRGVDPKPIKNPSALWDYELRDRRFNDGVLHLAKVGSYKPNAWGLYDMHGNVAEWTRSAYRPYPYDGQDGRNNEQVDERKTVRGGSWYRRSIRATSSWRWGYPGWMRPFDVGFRVIIEE